MPKLYVGEVVGANGPRTCVGLNSSVYRKMSLVLDALLPTGETLPNAVDRAFVVLPLSQDVDPRGVEGLLGSVAEVTHTEPVQFSELRRRIGGGALNVAPRLADDLQSARKAA